MTGIEIHREGDLGYIVTFRDEETDELLWKSPMVMNPREGEVVTHFDAAGEPTSYKVERVSWAFRHETLTAVPPGGDSVKTQHELAWYGCCCHVSPE